MVVVVPRLAGRLLVADVEHTPLFVELLGCSLHGAERRKCDEIAAKAGAPGRSVQLPLRIRSLVDLSCMSASVIERKMRSTCPKQLPNTLDTAPSQQWKRNDSRRSEWLRIRSRFAAGVCVSLTVVICRDLLKACPSGATIWG